MKILFVEDSGLLRRSMVKAAQEAGFKTVEAGNGVEALVCLRTHGSGIDLIVLDWNMPMMSGYDVLVKIRSQGEYKNIPVLMATSDGIEANVKMAVAAGATGYLVKPFTTEALVTKINGIISTCKAHNPSP